MIVRAIPWPGYTEPGRRLTVEVQSTAGDIVTDDDFMADVFATYYEKLYTAGEPVSGDSLRSFLAQTSLVWVDGTAREWLNAPLTLEGVTGVIRALASGKTPGGDGLPIEFYKHYIDLLAARLLAVYAKAFETGCLPRLVWKHILFHC